MQNTAFGQAEIAGYLKVEKVSGAILYYKVVDDQSIEIDETEYLEGVS